MNFLLSPHAQSEIQRRSIPPGLVDSVLQQPQQIVTVMGGKKAYQSQVTWPDGTIYLLRVIVDDVRDPPVVVTVYRTSKIQKHWSKP